MKETTQEAHSKAMDENYAEMAAADAEIEKLRDLDLEEFKAQAIKHLKKVNESVGGTTGALYHAARQYGKDYRHAAKLLGKRFKEIDEVLEIAYERVRTIEYLLWITIVMQLRRRGVYSPETGRFFADELHVDLDASVEAMKGTKAA